MVLMWLVYNSTGAVSSKKSKHVGFFRLYSENPCWNMYPGDVEITKVVIIKLIKHEAVAGWKDKRLEMRRCSNHHQKYLLQMEVKSCTSECGYHPPAL